MTVVAVAVLALVAVDALRHRAFLRLAVRNILRRPNEALLVVLGSMLGTAIITASLIVGDTVEATERDVARTKLGEIDVIVSDRDDPDRAARLADELDVSELPGVDGLLTLRRAGATAATIGPERVAEPHAGIVELDFDDARAFGSKSSATGFAEAGATPTGDDAVVGEDLADELDLDIGDRFQVFAYGASRDLVVRDLVPRLGLAGFGSGGRARAPVVFVPPGTIDSLLEAGSTTLDDASRPEGLLLVSGPGAIFEAGVDRRLEDAIEAAADRVEGVSVWPTKRERLERAADEGASMGQLFTGIGGFSVVAGILLLVNIFVMLSEERKTELGILRAVGMKRNHLVRSFGIEGAIYSVAAALAGGLAGIGVARLISGAANRLQDDGGALEMRFAVEPSTLLTGMTIGLLIALVTVWATSIRIGRLNVIRAIRDLPEPAADRSSTRSALAATLGVVVGVLLFQVGVAGSSAVPTLAGPAIGGFSAIPLLRRILPDRLAVTGPCLAVILWGVLAFSLVPSAFESADIPVFVVQGVLLVGAAVGALTVNTDVLGHATERITALGGGVAARLGLAYPLARRFRTGLLLGMFALVMFTLTFLATISNIFSGEAPRLAELEAGEWDLVVDSAGSNPIPSASLADAEDVLAVAPLRRTGLQFTTGSIDDADWWTVTGVDASVLAPGGAPELSQRADAFASDLEAWQAVLDDTSSPRWAIVPEFFLQRQDGPPTSTIDVGDRITMLDPATDRTEEILVAGLREVDFTWSGVLLPDGFVQDFASGSAVNRHLVQASPGVDLESLGGRLNGAFLENGAEARTFEQIVDDDLATQLGFFSLIQGYLALGLVIGIAGLGVVMVRAVRERRREIGMMRAMGFSSATVRRSFMTEAAFIALQGIVIGIALGLITSWSMLTSSTAFGEQSLPFQIPWGSLVLVFVVPLVASLLAVAAPARTASRIRPAVALRITD